MTTFAVASKLLAIVLCDMLFEAYVLQSAANAIHKQMRRRYSNVKVVSLKRGVASEEASVFEIHFKNNFK